ncbi:lactate transporter [Phycicoccus sp. Root563]|uniref:L-lactate permease n=1 Tax=Phycicoccus sp. Root563 TaxID=1736562 RepID=UPI0007036F47|nr:L-lactate permease [Phycicoccus sp. Root563]KQZ88724.1 lactate transporter [Phycicoccus sp. Root563]
MYRPELDSVAGSLTITALVAMLPLLTLFVLLGVLRLAAWKAALISLAVSIVVALTAYSMPVGATLSAGLEGAAFGFFPILWIVINAIWVYNMTVETGHFDVLRRSFAKVSDDQRIQAVIIAFCFGALLEALAGFGTPVAITSVMLIALGFRPMKAAVVALVANTAPVAFGALAVPITTLATVSGESEHHLAQIVGRQTPLLGVFVPMALVYIVDKGKGVRATLPATLTCGIAFAVAQFATSNFLSTQLTDIVAALVGALSVVVLLRVWQPSDTYVETETDDDELVGARSSSTGGAARSTGATAASGTRRGEVRRHDEPVPSTSAHDLAARDEGKVDSTGEVVKAYAPYLIIIALFILAQLPGIKGALDAPTRSFGWPGLDGLQTASGKASTLPTFKLNWLSAAGTLMLLSGLLTIPAIGISPSKALRAYGATYRQLASAILTVMAVLGLAYVMNASGQTASLGSWMAGAGSAFAILSPILGWLGVAVTGSDTSSNSLFGALQVSAAKDVGLSPALMAAANSSGGVLGKMISPQNLAIAAAAVGLSGREGDLFRKVVGWSLGFLAFMCVIVFLQSTAVLGWMLP